MTLFHKHRYPGLWRPKYLPSGDVVVDRSHPLGRNLVCCYAPVNGAQPRDLTGQWPLFQSTGGAPVIAGPYGPTLQSTAINQYSGVGNLGTGFTTRYPVDRITVACFVDSLGASANSNSGFFGMDAPSFAAYYMMGKIQSPQGQLLGQVLTSTGGLNLYSNAVPLASVTNGLSLAMTWRSGGNQTLYINGAQDITQSGGAGTLLSSATSYVYAGCDPNIGARDLKMQFHIGFIYAAELSPDLIAWLHAEPFCMLVPRANSVLGIAAPALGSFNFPDSPVSGQTFQRYKWDGEKWILTMGGRPMPAPHSTEAVAFLARTSGLDTTHTNAYYALINGLVTDGIWDKLDVLYIYATQDSTTARLNLISTNYPATVNGSPTFTADRGYTGVDSSTTTYINPGFNAATAISPKHVQNSAHLSVWNVTNQWAIAPGIGTSITASGNSNFCWPRDSASGWSYLRINVNTGIDNLSMPNASGHFIANRSGSNARQGYRNGALAVSGGQASIAVTNAPMYALGSNVDGAPKGAGQQHAMASIGSSLDVTQAANFYARLRTYMTAVGVP